MAFLTKDQIKENTDYRQENITVWGGELCIRSMTAQDRIEFEARQVEDKKDMPIMISMIVACCVNEEGDKFFSVDDASWLLQKSPESLLKIFEVCVKLNTLTKDNIEDKAKNS